MASGPCGGGSGSGGSGDRGISGSATYGGSSVEAEAVNYFKLKMAKKDEKFLPIVSVAGYSSQVGYSSVIFPPILQDER